MSAEHQVSPGPSNIAFFGSFYPRIDRLATTSVGMVYLISKCRNRPNVTVIGPKGSEIPENYASNVKIEPLWEYDDIPSIVRAFFFLLRRKKKYDLVFFNLILTSFGKRNLSNGIGLLIPPVYSILTRKRPVVYIHNLVETQSLEKLGYGNAYLSKQFAKMLEKIIFDTADIFLPLESQRKTVERIYGMKVEQSLFVGVEGIWSFKNYLSLHNRSDVNNLGKRRILLFGAWGPQKDIINLLKMLKTLSTTLKCFLVTVAGSINQNFPEYREKISNIFLELDSDRFSFVENPEENEIPELFINSDILILPYNATGGYSAVMNIARLYCIKIIAYDIDELREIAQVIGGDVDFIPRDNRENLERVLLDFVWEPKLRSAEEELAEILDRGSDQMTKILKTYSKQDKNT